MPLTLNLNGLQVHITAAPLTPEAFAPFGEVIQNPRPDIHPARYAALSTDTGGNGSRKPFEAVSANQGSAIKYQHVTRMRNLYPGAPSGVPGVAVMNMFVCGARKLQPERRGSLSVPASGISTSPAPGGVGSREKDSGGESESESESLSEGGIFPVGILERHPFTTQTFIPLTSDPGTRYLVIVAPSLPPDKADESLPVPSSSSQPSVPSSSSSIAPDQVLPGRGLPDLRRLRAFVASVEQAVTYGAGTWHAPMVALGKEGTAVDFVVVQFANGMGIEDCQEVVFSSSPSALASGQREEGDSRGAVSVLVPRRERVAKL